MRKGDAQGLRQRIETESLDPEEGGEPGALPLGFQTDRPSLPFPFSWHKEENAEQVSFFLEYGCQTHCSPPQPWHAEGLFACSGSLSLSLLSPLPPKICGYNQSLRGSQPSWFIPCQFLCEQELAPQAAPVATRRRRRGGWITAEGTWTHAIDGAGCVPGCQKAAWGHTRLRSWQPTAKQVAAELAEVPWRKGWRDAAARAKERGRERQGSREAWQVADGGARGRKRCCAVARSQKPFLHHRTSLHAARLRNVKTLPVHCKAPHPLSRHSLRKPFISQRGCPPLERCAHSRCRHREFLTSLFGFDCVVLHIPERLCFHPVLGSQKSRRTPSRAYRRKNRERGQLKEGVSSHELRIWSIHLGHSLDPQVLVGEDPYTPL